MRKICSELFEYCYKTLKYTLKNNKIPYEEYKGYIITSEVFNKLSKPIAYSISLYVYFKYDYETQKVELHGSKEDDIRINKIFYKGCVVGNKFRIELGDYLIEKYQTVIKYLEIQLDKFILDKKVIFVTIFKYKDKSDWLYLSRFTYEEEIKEKKKRGKYVLGMDLGKVIFAAGTSSKDGDNFLIRASRLKETKKTFIYNKKEMMRSAASLNKKIGEEKLAKKTRKKEQKRKEFPMKAAKMVIEYCIKEDIGIIVVGFLYELVGIGKIYSYEHRDFVNRLKKLAERHNIKVICIDERNYTSQKDFFTGEKGIRDREKNRGQIKFRDGTSRHSDTNSSGNMILEAGIKIDKEKMKEKMSKPPWSMELYEKKKNKKKRNKKNRRSNHTD